MATNQNSHKQNCQTWKLQTSKEQLMRYVTANERTTPVTVVRYLWSVYHPQSAYTMTLRTDMLPSTAKPSVDSCRYRNYRSWLTCFMQSTSCWQSILVRLWSQHKPQHLQCKPTKSLQYTAERWIWHRQPFRNSAAGSTLMESVSNRSVLTDMWITDINCTLHYSSSTVNVVYCLGIC